MGGPALPCLPACLGPHPTGLALPPGALTRQGPALVSGRLEELGPELGCRRSGSGREALEFCS